MQLHKKYIGFVCFALSLGAVAFAKAETDPSFGKNGVATIPAPAGSHVTLSDLKTNDNKIYAFVTLTSSTPSSIIITQAVVKLLENGKPDPNFGKAGMATLEPLKFKSDELVLPTPFVGASFTTDGKILVYQADSAYRYNNYTLYRLNQNGTPDKSFGASGKVVVKSRSFGFSDGPTGIRQAPLALPDKRIVLAHVGFRPQALSEEIAFLYLTPQGKADSTFGRNGIRFVPEVNDFQLAYHYSNGVRNDNKGNIYLLGSVGRSSRESSPALVKLNTNAQLDPTFGTRGVKQLPEAGRMLPSVLHFGPRGEMLIALSAVRDTSSWFSDFALIKLRSDAHYDTRFGKGGVLSFHFDRVGQNDANIPYHIFESSKGEYLIGGGILSGAAGGQGPLTAYHTLSKVDKRGALDQSFGDGGLYTLFKEALFSGMHAATQSKGRFLSGRTSSDSRSFTVSRYFTEE